MEVFDGQLEEVDEEGHLNLKNRDWVTVDEHFYEYGSKVKVFDASDNKIIRLSPGIGQLTHLIELNLCNNFLEGLPDEIGHCRSLLILSVKFNRLRCLPESIGDCSLLEEIYLSDNVLRSIPASIGNLRYLRILHVQNNRLKELPGELSACDALEDVEFVGNEKLASLPPGSTADVGAIKWFCKQKKEHEIKVASLENTIFRLERLVRLKDENRIDLALTFSSGIDTTIVSKPGGSAREDTAGNNKKPKGVSRLLGRGRRSTVTPAGMTFERQQSACVVM